MMEAARDWLDRAVQSSLDVPHPAEIDAQKAIPDTNGTGNNISDASNIVPFRILIKSLELLPSSVSSVRCPMSTRSFHSSLLVARCSLRSEVYGNIVRQFIQEILRANMVQRLASRQTRNRQLLSSESQ